MTRQLHLSGVLRAAAWACLASAVVCTIPEAVAGQPSPDSRIGRAGMPAVFQMNRATAVRTQGLDDPRLGLTQAQRAEIDRILDAFVLKQTSIQKVVRTAPGERANPEAVAAMSDAVAKLASAVESVLNPQQKQVRESVLAARRSSIVPTMPGQNDKK